MLENLWSWLGAKAGAGEKVQPIGLPSFEPLEPRVLLSADFAGTQPPVDLGGPLGEQAVVADLDTAGEGLPTMGIDALTVPEEVREEWQSAPSLVGAVPYGADAFDGSEFMIGDVWVTVALLESNGVIDPNTENWTAGEITSVKTEIQEGLAWWESTFHTVAPVPSSSDLTFHIDFTHADAPVATRYEPINRPGPSDQGQALWIDDFLTSVGYNTASSHFVDMDQWNHAQRVAQGTDWAYTIFVVDSSVDPDGKFTDDYFAYAYFGGPFLVMTYDNDGWGIDRMGQVLAHESGHIFFALDEYPGSGGYYTSRSGYYNTQNLNAYDGNPNPGTRVASIMAEASLQNAAYAAHTSSPTSLQMLGWLDSDSDGIMDVLDVPLTLSGSGAYNPDAGQYQFTGTSSVATLNNLNPNGSSQQHDLTTNVVDRIQYRVDGGSWVNGNTYGGYTQSVSQSVPIPGGVTHTVELRTIFEETGLTSPIWSDTFSGANAEVTVLGHGVPIADGDTTPNPVDDTEFGGVVQGGLPIARTFTVRNDGAGTLTLGTVTVPAGYTLTEGLATSLGPGASDEFTVQLDAAVAGPKDGEVSFATNDPDEDPFNFRISGTVGNLALSRPIVASTSYAGLPAANATDGNLDSRWSSLFSDNEWIYVDLGSVFTIDRVVLRWEVAYGRGYKLQVSDNASYWSDVYSTTTGDGGVDDITLSSPGSGRYLRVLGTQRGTMYGYSLWEFEVYGGGVVNHAPAVSNFSKSLTQDASLPFAAGDFSGAFTDPDAGDSLQKIKITSLPSHGVLRLNGTAVTVDQEIATAQIGVLSYAPNTGYTGSDSFQWNGSDGSLYAATAAAVNLSINAAAANLALGKTAVASTSYAGFPASNTTDGNVNSRWSSLFSDSEWISVDLGSVYTINRIVLRWETAYGRGYKLQVSNDASTWSDVYTTTTGDGGVDDVTLSSPVSGRYVRLLGTQRGTVYGYSLYELEVYAGAAAPNLALGKTAVASTSYPGFPASNVTDGNASSRWSSQFSDSQWLYVDLGAVFTIHQVVLRWETAYGRGYTIQVSNDASTWSDVYSTTTGDGGVDDITLATPASGRYVRLLGTQRATAYGYSLWEFEVYG